MPSVSREDFVGDKFGLLPPEFQLALLFAAFGGKQSFILMLILLRAKRVLIICVG